MGRTFLVILVLGALAAAGYILLQPDKGSQDNIEPAPGSGPSAAKVEETPPEEEPSEEPEAVTPSPDREQVTTGEAGPEGDAAPSAAQRPAGEPGKIIGTIRGEGGRPLPGATVQIIRFEYNPDLMSGLGRISIDNVHKDRIVAETASDENGRYEFADLEGDNPRYVRASTTDYIEQVKDGVRPGQVVDFMLVRGHRVEGVVRDAATEEPVEDARVKAWYSPAGAGRQQGTSYFWKKQVYTDEKGRFAFDGVPAKNILFQVFHEAYEDLKTNEVIQADVLNKLDFEIKKGLVIAGRVLDKLTGEPVPGIQVALKSNPFFIRFRARTDENGTFKAKGLERGGHHIVLSGNGYTRTRVRRSFSDKDAFDPESGNYMEFLVEPAGSAVGVVRDSEGNPLPNVRVFVARETPLNFQVRSPQSAEAVTAEDGSFLVEDLNAGHPYKLAAYRDGFSIADSEKFSVGPGELREGVDITLTHGSTIRGRVTDERGVPVAYAVVTVNIPPYSGVWFMQSLGQMSTRRVETGEDGRFSVDTLWPGRYTLSINHPEHVGLTDQRIEIEEDNTVIERDFTLQIGRYIAGQVDNPDGSPAEGALVKAYQGWSNQPAGSARADETGHYRVANLGKGSYRVEAEREGYTCRPMLNVPHDSDNVNLQLVEPGSITGAVSYDDGSPVQGFTVSLLRADLGLDTEREVKATEAMGGVSRGIRDPGGIFMIEDVDPGTYDVRISSPEGLPIRMRDIRVNPGMPTDVGMVTLRRGATLRGRILSSEGLPVGNAQIIVANQELQGKLQERGGNKGDSVEGEADYEVRRAQWGGRTGNDGRYTISGLPPGPYEMTVRAAEYVDPDPLGFEVGSATEVTKNVTLEKAGRVVLELRDAYGSAVRAAVGQVFAVTPERRRVGLRRPPRSDGNGKMVINGLGSGSYVVIIRRASYVTREVALEVTAGETVRKVIELDKI